MFCVRFTGLSQGYLLSLIFFDTKVSNLQISFEIQLTLLLPSVLLPCLHITGFAIFNWYFVLFGCLAWKPNFCQILKNFVFFA